MADADGAPVDVRHALPDGLDQGAELLRHDVARGIGDNVERGSGFDGRLAPLVELSRIGTASFLGAKLDGAGALPGQLDRAG